MSACSAIAKASSARQKFGTKLSSTAPPNCEAGSICATPRCAASSPLSSTSTITTPATPPPPSPNSSPFGTPPSPTTTTTRIITRNRCAQHRNIQKGETEVSLGGFLTHCATHASPCPRVWLVLRFIGYLDWCEKSRYNQFTA